MRGFAFCLLLGWTLTFAQIGYDAFSIEKWPLQRLGMRAYMRSTYDRSGGNEGADASHFLYQEREDFNVALDVAGPGILYFTRFNHWHGSPWHFEIDGKDMVVSESSTSNPLRPKLNSVFSPANIFREPFAYTWSTTKGADLSWVPIGFKNSFRLAYSRTHYGTGYYIIHRVPFGTSLKLGSRAAAESLLKRAGTDIAPKYIRILSGTQGEAVIRGNHCIRAIEIEVPKQSVNSLERSWLQMFWDGRKAPSVDVPLPLFFGTGTLFNRDRKEYLVKALPVNVKFTRNTIILRCFFPMPFFRSARFRFSDVPGMRWRIRYEPLKYSPQQVGYFHATYRDHPRPSRGHDLVLLNTLGIENSKDWSGHFIGTSLIFSHNADLTTLEGDPRFFFDDSKTPQCQGTGTEEWCGGGDYWGGRTMTLPLVGHPTGAPNAKAAINSKDNIESAYRFLLSDVMPFGKNALIRLEHGGNNDSNEHYETVAYWYGSPAASLVKTDTLDVSNSISRKWHTYQSPTKVAYKITSRYEQGLVHTEIGLLSRGICEFSLRLRPDNLGVLLRRKLDYAFANQKAQVYIQRGRKWRFAGTWFLAGSTKCVYSNPTEELGKAQQIVQTCESRFSDDEFLIGKDLTQGRSIIRIKLKFIPMRRPIYPGGPIQPSGWSEIRYSAYCFVTPKFRP